MSRILQFFATMCLVPIVVLADFSNDVAYIAKECLTCAHYDAFEGSLLTFAKRNNLSDNEMAARLLFIADPGNGFKSDGGLPLTREALSGICLFRNAQSALPSLEKYMLDPTTCSSVLFGYGYITGYDNRFFSFISNALETGKLDKGIVCRYLYSAIKNPDTDSWKTSEQSRLRMCALIVRYANPTFDSLVYSDRFLSGIIPEYANSLDHVRTQEVIFGLLNEKRDRIVKYSCYRGEWGNISDDEWYRRATNSCQSEIARVMSLPEGERLNMTEILDAKIAAIEEAEARAARRAVWKRRLRIGAFLVLPVLCIAVAILFVLKKKTTAIPFTVHGCGKAGWCRTVESFVVVIVMIVVAGIVAFLDHRPEGRETTAETAPPASFERDRAALEWLDAHYEECRREKERADAAVLNYRVTNQLYSIVDKCESLKLAYNQVLADLAETEIRMSNETNVAQLDLLRKQTASLHEKVAENVRERAELHDRILKEESKLSQLESARELANQNFLNALYRMEEAYRSVEQRGGFTSPEPGCIMGSPAKRTKGELKPVWTVSATLDGRLVSDAILSLGGRAYVLNPEKRIAVHSGSTYGPGEVTFEKDGRIYSGILPQVTVDKGWKGERRMVVALAKRMGPATGSRAGELKTIDVGPQAIRLHWCPTGSFLMGSPPTENGRYNDETQHRVKFTKGFWMGETEVTQGLWKEVMGGETVFKLAQKGLSDDNKYEISGKKQTLREVWGLARHSDSTRRCGDLNDSIPVYNVSWNDVDDFCRRLTARAHAVGELAVDYEFSLPTEAQWEYACRAGSATSLPNGEEIEILGENNAPALDGIAWYGGNSSVGFKGRGWDTSDWKEKQYPDGWACVREVRGKAANAWGLYDMIGNVSEWCSDWYGAYPGGVQINPSGASEGSFRVIRGGSWGNYARGCRPARRVKCDPGCRGIHLGFRIVLRPVR